MCGTKVRDEWDTEIRPNTCLINILGLDLRNNYFVFAFQEGDVLELSQVNDIRAGKLPVVG